uniref:Uncharacterized protein n=1 Tax=Alexandrium andersonii TaxID=327968 RepID=A0A7S2AMW8_9DINO
MGAGSLGGGLAAARSCDMSVYLPTSQCIQLVINGLTGIFVWGDGQRIQASVSYFLVFFLILLGVYLCSELDLVDTVQQRRAARDAALQRARFVSMQSNNAQQPSQEGLTSTA